MFQSWEQNSIRRLNMPICLLDTVFLYLELSLPPCANPSLRSGKVRLKRNEKLSHQRALFPSHMTRPLFILNQISFQLSSQPAPLWLIQLQICESKKESITPKVVWWYIKNRFTPCTIPVTFLSQMPPQGQFHTGHTGSTPYASRWLPATPSVNLVLPLKRTAWNKHLTPGSHGWSTHGFALA